MAQRGGVLDGSLNKILQRRSSVRVLSVTQYCVGRVVFSKYGAASLGTFV